MNQRKCVGVASRRHRLRVLLTREQDQTLLTLKTADVRQKVKDRAEVIRKGEQKRLE